MTRRIGIYPGTFDPLHQGHLAFCLETIRRGEVDEVVLLPEPSPRSKPGATTIEERRTLLTIATAQFPLVSVVGLMSNRFTVAQTLPELHEHFKGDQLCLLIGSDIVPSLPLWENVETLLRDVPLIVGLREGDAAEVVETILSQIGQTRDVTIRYSLVETTHADVASSLIRSGKMAVNLQAIMDI